MSASRLALVLVCALLAGGAAAAVPESASSALTISARDDGPGRNAQEGDAESARLRREQAYRDTRRMRQLPPEVVAALVRGTVEFDDLSFNDDDTVVDDDAVRALKTAAAPPPPRACASGDSSRSPGLRTAAPRRRHSAQAPDRRLASPSLTASSDRMCRRRLQIAAQPGIRDTEVDRNRRESRVSDAPHRRASRSLLARAWRVNGFWMKWTPSDMTPCAATSTPE